MEISVLLRTFSIIGLACLSNAVTASSLSYPLAAPKEQVFLYEQPSFFRFSYDHMSMPNDIEDMGLMGLTYFANITPNIYAGVGGYGSVSGSQGGLFVLGFAAGYRHVLINRLWIDLGLFAGGGGGRSSLVGGGLMIRPHVGLFYDLDWLRLGVHYSYVDFPDGKIGSKQIGVDIDVPFDFYHVRYRDALQDTLCHAMLKLCNGTCLSLQRNDFSILLQAYRQKQGTQNVWGQLQDGTISLVGAELDHYMTERLFWWVKASGAYHGIPNGYMDVLGGIGYLGVLNRNGIALVPQLGAGAGGGGNVDTGGGILITPQLGLQVPLTSHVAVRLNGGYLWAPSGQLKAATATGLLIYHLDMAGRAGTALKKPTVFWAQGWRIHLFNQTYLRPQRTFTTATPVINMVALQIDQLFTPYFFLSYQAASAYQGDHAGGYATGMIGAGLQTPLFLEQKAQLYTTVLLGAGGGGNLALAGGALIEPIVGLHYFLTEGIGLTLSVSQLKAINHELNTPVVNAGLTIRFGTANRR